MEEERWKKENGNEDLILSLSCKEREKYLEGQFMSSWIRVEIAPTPLISLWCQELPPDTQTHTLEQSSQVVTPDCTCRPRLRQRGSTIYISEVRQECLTYHSQSFFS